VVSFPPTAQRPFAAYTFYHVTHQNFYLTTNSTNFHEWGAASPENFIIGFIRVHSCHLTQSLPLFRPSGQPWVALSRIRPDARLWFIFSLQPRSARSRALQSQTAAAMLLRHALAGGKTPAHRVSCYFWTTPLACRCRNFRSRKL
jgi:hypothetical protein